MQSKSLETGRVYMLILGERGDYITQFIMGNANWSKKTQRKGPNIGSIFKPVNGKLIFVNYALSDEDLEQVFSNNMTSVTTVNLSQNILSGISPLFKSMQAAKMNLLKTLNLQKNQLQDPGLQILCEGEWPLLSTLLLNKNRITSKGMAYFQQAQFNNLEVLQLDHNWINSQGILELTKSNFPKLANLSLFHNLLEDKAMKYLRQSHFQELQILNLAQNMISGVGVRVLLMRRWAKIKQLRLWNEDLSRQEGQLQELGQIVVMRLGSGVFQDLMIA